MNSLNRSLSSASGNPRSSSNCFGKSVIADHIRLNSAPLRVNTQNARDASASPVGISNAGRSAGESAGPSGGMPTASGVLRGEQQPQRGKPHQPVAEHRPRAAPALGLDRLFEPRRTRR